MAEKNEEKMEETEEIEEEKTEEEMTEEEKKKDNPFNLQTRMRTQNLKELQDLMLQEEEIVPAQVTAFTVDLKPRIRKKKTYTVYLDIELMERVQRLAKQKGVAYSVVVEACVKMALEQLES